MDMPMSSPLGGESWDVDGDVLSRNEFGRVEKQKR